MFSSAAFAQEGAEIDSIGLLSQNQFGDMSRDLGAALTYRRTAPAEWLGSVGFNLGVGLSATRLEHSSALDSASSDDTPDSLLMSNLYLQKGLPLGFDVGAFYTSVPDSNISLLGGGLSYALLSDSALTPALSVQGSYSRMSGVDDLKLDTRGIDLSISKGISLLTPYAGIGRIWVNSNPGGARALSLRISLKTATSTAPVSILACSTFPCKATPSVIPAPTTSNSAYVSSVSA